MTTRKRRRPAPSIDIAHTFQTYLFQREVAATATKEKEKAAKELRKATIERGVVALDEYGNEIHGGNIEYALDDPIQVGNKVYAGMEMRKSPQISFDEDTAMDLARAKKIPLADVVGTVTLTMSYSDYEQLQRESTLDSWDITVYQEVNQDAFYVLNQQGKITDDELDSLLIEGEPKYSLWPIERTGE